jgi:hypothetical protein
MSGIQQIFVNYVPAQDRILVRVSTTENTEMRMWLTRRFITVLWPVMLQMLESDPSVVGQSNTQSKQEVLSFRHEEAISKTRFTKSYQTPPQAKPVNQVPFLITKLSTKRLDNGRTQMMFGTAKGRSVQFVVDRTLTHSLCKLIADCTSTANWGLDLNITTSSAAALGDRTIN